MPKPTIKESDEVLVKVESAVLNPTDILFMRGLYRLGRVSYPVIAGAEGSGVIVDVGEDLKD